MKAIPKSTRLFFVFVAALISTILSYLLYHTVSTWSTLPSFTNALNAFGNAQNRNFFVSGTNYSGLNLEYCAACGTGKNKCGKSFSKSWIPYLYQFNVSDEQVSKMNTQDDTRILKKDPVFVTSFSDSHWDHAFRNVIPTFRRLTKHFYVYDLGLSDDKIAEEMLHEFEAIFYADAHYYYSGSEENLTSLLQKARCQDSCSSKISGCCYYNWLLLSFATHSIYATTHPGVYEYLPLDLEISKRVQMGQAGMQLIYSTKDVRTNVLKWWILCALEKDCMGPPKAQLQCDFSISTLALSGHAGCHRYDQSAINILLAIRNCYNARKHIVEFGGAHW